MRGSRGIPTVPDERIHLLRVRESSGKVCVVYVPTRITLLHQRTDGGESSMGDDARSFVQAESPSQMNAAA
ncbi:hypothetical protein MRB53_039686 [Persea americana]|nr:hypothetical protein MRB53_039686 [Persea americana]